MTYDQWHTTIRHREHGDKLDRDPKGYFAAGESAVRKDAPND